MGTGNGDFPFRTRRGDDQWRTVTQNPCREISADQDLEAAFARLHLAPHCYRSQHPGLIGDMTCGSRLENSVNNFTPNRQHLLPFLMQATQPPNVALPPLMPRNGGICNGDYWTGMNNEEWDGLAYRGLDVIEQRATQNSLLFDARRWLGREEHGGQLMRSAPFSYLNVSPFDVSTDSCLLMDDLRPIKLNSTRSTVNDWRDRSLQKPSNNHCLDNFRGKYVSLAKDQYGCRLLQKKMEGMTDRKVDELFMELIEHVGELMIDPYGNYVIQKLVEVCSVEQRTQILFMVTMTNFQLVNICLNVHGTRAVQKLLDKLTTQEQISLVMSAVSPGAVALTKDTNGHHVIQHCLQHFSNENNRYLLNEVADNCVGIATDKSGCCVLQHCVDHSQGEMKERLIAEIISNALQLATDRFGNYVVQHVLGLKMPSVTATLLRQLRGSHMSLSCDKFGSNVVEKCISDLPEEQSAQVVMELLTDQNASMLLVDPYANYVIQTALSVSKGRIYDALLSLVRINCPRMRSNPYGRKILGWFQNRKTKK